MANIKSAKKRARQSLVRREHNVWLMSRMRSSIKQVIKQIQAGDKTAAADSYRSASKLLDGAVNKGLIHRNKAARHKSRLNTRLKAL